MSSTASDQVPNSPDPEKRSSTATATFVGDEVDPEKRIPEQQQQQPATGFARCADGRLGRDISAPFNFKHESHVGAQFTGFPGSWRYTGLPASWAAALATQPPAPSPESSSHHRCFLLKLPSPILALKNMSPSQRWNRVWTACTIKFHPHPVEDENISLPFNFKHEVHAESKYTPSWHAALILAAEDSWRSTLALSQGQRSNQLPKKSTTTIRFPSFSFSSRRQQQAFTQTDEDISLPWNFQHNVHVDTKFNGLPPSWRATLENEGFPFPIPEPCCPHICVGNFFTNKI